MVDIHCTLQLARSSSVNKSTWTDLAKHDVQVLAVDLLGPKKDIVNALQGTYIVNSTIFSIWTHQDQMNLISASKKAGVGRIVPGCWGPVVPPMGVLTMRDEKEEIINHTKKIKLPYTTSMLVTGIRPTYPECRAENSII